jgi:putative acetyltransferase
MKIRKFTPEDAIKLSKLMRETIITSNTPDYPKKAIKVLVDEFTPKYLIKHSSKDVVFVASQNEKLLGTISLVGNRIARMFVLPKVQTKGIGSKLIKHLEKFAKKKGEKMLRVRSSLTAFGFYQKLGYHKTRKASNKLIGQIIWLRKKI